MRARRAMLWAAVAILAQASCAEIPTAPRQMVTLHGSVITRDGEPVVAVRIVFRDAGNPYRYTSPVATSAADGSFQVDLAVGTYNVILEPSTSSGVPHAEVPGVRIAELNPRFDYRYRGVRVEGTVIGPHGTAVKEAKLAFRSDEPADLYYLPVRYTTNEGRFRVYLPAATYSCEAAPLGSNSGVPSLAFYGISVDADTTLDLHLTGYRVSGLVTRPEGSPMASARIEFSGDGASVSATSLPDGTYELFVPAGLYRNGGYPGLADTDVEARRFGDLFVAGDLTHNIPFTGVWWTGTIRGPEDGAPVAGADLWVWPYYSPPYPHEIAHVVTDASGSFKVSVATPGWHEIQVAAPGREVERFETIPAGADSTFDLTAGALVAP